MLGGVGPRIWVSGVAQCGFASGGPCAIRITETERYLILEVYGYHHPGCHSCPIMSGRKLARAPVVGGSKSCFRSGGDSNNVKSGMSRLDIFSHPVQYRYLVVIPTPHRHADGDQCVVRRAASNVAFNIMHASVPSSPITNELPVAPLGTTVML